MLSIANMIPLEVPYPGLTSIINIERGYVRITSLFEQ
jgi:hypothetical protein